MNNPRLRRLLTPGTTAPRAHRPTQHAASRVTTGGQDAAASTGSFVEGEALFLACLPVIDDITGQVCRRHRLNGAEAEDFRSEVHLHFIERDYEVLRRFEHRSS